jgi:hypothetical protein
MRVEMEPDKWLQEWNRNATCVLLSVCHKIQNVLRYLSDVIIKQYYYESEGD